MTPRCSTACAEEIKRLQDDIGRLTRALAAVTKSGWSCPNCGKAHGPQMQTCPMPPGENRPLRDRIRVSNG
jgi:uncharacterized OB-fold protein